MEENKIPEEEFKDFYPDEYKEGFIRKFVNNDDGEIKTEYISGQEMLDMYIEYCWREIENGNVNFRLDTDSKDLEDFFRGFILTLPS